MLIDDVDFAELSDERRQAIRGEGARFSAALGADRERHVLIVGGSGYIGGPLTRHLLAHGARVRNLDSLVYDHGAAMLGFLGHPRYSFEQGDMGNPRALARALEGITDVVLLAGLVGDPITRRFPAAAGAINDDALRTCVDHLDGRGLNKVVFVSTCSNYGMIGETEIATETFALKPLSLYAKSKVAAESYFLSLRDKVDYAPTILRFATAFGLSTRTRFDLTVNEFTRELALGRDLLVFDAETWRPYCHVEDFARLIGRVLEWPIEAVAFEIFNAGGDENNHTKQSIVELISKRVRNPRVTYQENSDDPRNYRVSFEKVRETLGFKPRRSVGDGIDQIIWALRTHLLDDVPLRRDFYGNYSLPNLGG